MVVMVVVVFFCGCSLCVGYDVYMCEQLLLMMVQNGGGGGG